MKIKVIDNFLPNNDFQKLSAFMKGETIPWFYAPTNYNPEAEDEADKLGIIKKGVADKNNFYFNHLIYHTDRPQSQVFDQIYQMVYDKLEIKSLIRMKGNLYPRTKDVETHEWHRDYAYGNRAAILYINTNDGYTQFKKDGSKIESVANRVLIFNGNELHRSTSCSDQNTRINININYL